jgi:hypothetical protein
MKTKAEYLMREFGFTLRLPQYYSPDPALVESLKVCIEDKKSNPSGLEKISK